MTDKPTDQDRLWWQPAVQLFFELWGWLVIPVVVALFVGTWLDEQFGTEPLLFLVVTGTAFVITIYGIIKRSSDVLKQIKAKEQTKADQQKDF